MGDVTSVISAGVGFVTHSSRRSGFIMIGKVHVGRRKSNEWEYQRGIGRRNSADTVW